MTPEEPAPLVAVTGASGYVGGRLVPELLAAGFRVRCLSRDPARLRDRPWAGDVEVVAGSADDPAVLARLLEGAEVAYYLIHALYEKAFEHHDRATARAFADAAHAAGVGRIVYLGGLGGGTETTSPHLRSRAEVGDLLLASGVPTVVLQAAVIIGSGSASFEMLRNLTERIPAMVTPRWVSNRIQPIAIRDVLRYLVAAASLPRDVSRAFDIGGPDILTYREMMQGYARIAGLKPRLIVPVPVLTPRLSSHWVGLVTPIPSRLAKPLVESLRTEVVCREHDIERWIPAPPAGLLGFEQAVVLALLRVGDGDVVTRWSNASIPGAPSDPLPTDPKWAGGAIYTDERATVARASVADLWDVVEGIGGDTGWYSWPAAWAARGVIDRLVGGVGLRRGRRDARHLYIGETVDFWRVEERVLGETLRLRAEMRLPGHAWLQFDVGGEDGAATLRQQAIFHPRGLPGRLYWVAVAPFHRFVFAPMARNIARAAEQRSTSL